MASPGNKDTPGKYPLLRRSERRRNKTAVSENSDSSDDIPLIIKQRNRERSLKLEFKQSPRSADTPTKQETQKVSSTPGDTPLFINQESLPKTLRAFLPVVQEAAKPVQPSKDIRNTVAMASRQNRTQRGGPRGNGLDAGEEMAIWSACQDDLRKITRLVARQEEARQEIYDLEAEIKNQGSKPSLKQIDELSSLWREQVKLGDEIQTIGKTGDDNVTQKIGLLKAMVEHNEREKAPSEPLRRAASSRDGSSRGMGMDVDGGIDSPAPSPVADKAFRKERLGGSRSSLPPKETPIKLESTEQVNSGIEFNAKGKITFAMGAEVAFRPKATGAEEPEWIQGVVVKIIGEGKSRRYDVQDPEPDEVTKKPGQIYRTSASSMVTIPPLGQPLGDYPRGKAVLARYPDTTTFYRAEVVGMNGTMVNLKFEGEEDAQVTMEVDRRFVLDHRG